jgi:glucosamine-6-phosphate deaminase
MRLHIHATPDQIGEAVAARILGGLAEANVAGSHYVLGCPGGRSPVPVYAAMAASLARNAMDCSRLIVLMMDEYLLSDASGAPVPPPASAHYSCRGFGEREIVSRLNTALPEAHRIRPENFWMPDVNDPAAYDDRIQAAGGIDHFILASGAGDGHIAFNPPGSARDSRTRIVQLAEQTRRDNLVTFPDFGSIDDTPPRGLTIGIGSIAALSKSVSMVLWGKDKQLAFQRLTRAKGYDPSWPASIAVECRAAELHADRSVADA